MGSIYVRHDHTGMTTDAPLPQGVDVKYSTLRSILYQKEGCDGECVQAHVLTFPNEYCGSVAIGCFINNKHNTNNDHNNKQVIFCKDRNRAEALVQQAGSQFGKLFTRTFYHHEDDKTTINSENALVVARCEVMDRPPLQELPIGSAGAKMWQLKEMQWERIYNEEEENDNGRNDDECDESSSSSSSSFSQAAPSKKDCWLLEEAIKYYKPTTEIQSYNNPSSCVDSSLRRKLRMAADRSVSGCLDMVTLFMLAEVSQKYVQGPNPEWPDYVESHKLDESTLPHLALTKDETNLLFRDKLVGSDIQIAMLYTMVTGLPDCHCGNMAIQEIDVQDESSSTGGTYSTWRLRIVHFDTGLTSVEAGVSLTSLQLAYDEDEDGVDYGIGFDFEGGSGGVAYYYPIIISSVFSEASQVPLEPRVRQRLLDMDGRELDRIARTEFDHLNIFDPKIHQQIGKIMQRRLDIMKEYSEKHPDCTCQDLAFATITAWKRDYPINELHEEFVKWLREVKEWAEC